MQNEGQTLALLGFFFPLFRMHTESKGKGAPHPSFVKPIQLVSRNFLELLEGGSWRVCEW